MAHISSSLPASERLYRGQHTHVYSPSRSHTHINTGNFEVPWGGMSNTFTWIEEQDLLKRGRRCIPMNTEDWVREQQTLLFQSNETATVYDNPRSRTTSKVRRQGWQDLTYIYEIEADQWMRHEERIRKVAHEREKARLRIQEELRRIDARYQQKRESERHAREEARRREQAESRERAKKERAKLDKLMVEAWSSYESRWSSLSTSTEQLEFKSIPWPVTVPPQNVEDITQDAIVTFLFSHLHARELVRKDRIRGALLRWHPDRFRRFLARIPETDRANVEEGVGVVARVLNELMAKENKRGHH